MDHADGQLVGNRSGGVVRLLVLGTAYSVADETHRHTHLALVGGGFGILLDCGVCPRSRLAALGVERDGITDVIITHFHPDHVSGLPLYLMELWLIGREETLTVHASDDCMDRIEEMLELFEWRKWPGMFPVDFQRIPNGEAVVVLEKKEALRVTASPMQHLVPTMGIRLQLREGAGIVYSSDTEPTDALRRLAQEADWLIHEATGEGVGHSSAAQAGELAREAGVKNLMLIHYDPSVDTERLLREARAVFPGEVILAKDGLQLPISAGLEPEGLFSDPQR